ncbi:MAG: DUF72 domain-containing protein [Pseudomonadota bacterium]|nr:DUF72 domain-containing protein [Pseudomonadota bacterium]
MSAIVGTAGWSIPAKDAEHFGSDGSTLQRYAQRFQGVEVNSCFHRPHRASTWARWGESVPASFRFAVKVPKTISHQRKLVDCADLVERFLGELRPLEGKLAVLLLQLPPKLAFSGAVGEDFFEHFSKLMSVRIVCEPRHPSWFEAGADALLDRLRVARVAADPAVNPEAALPGGWRGFSYWRLHGSPTMYRSAYDATRLDAYAALIRAETARGRDVWCMFDNTAASAATGDALALMARLR